MDTHVLNRKLRRGFFSNRTVSFSGPPAAWAEVGLPLITESVRLADRGFRMASELPSPL
jgi:hypothetical protein